MAGFDLQIWAPLGVDEELTTMVVENVEFVDDDPGTWADPPAAGRLGEIAVPTLVITGAQDVPESAPSASCSSAGSRRARGRDREGGRRRPWRAPDELAGMILEFLA